MVDIIRFQKPEGPVFDAEATALLTWAFEKACAELDQPASNSLVREIIAKRIVEIAGRGERDPDRLLKATLDSLGFEREH